MENKNLPSENFYETLSLQQKEILHNSKINFQGHFMELSRLVENNFEICSSLSSSQIKEILDGKILEVGTKIPETKFSPRILRMKIDSYSENEFKVFRSIDFVFNENKRNYFHLYYEDKSEQLRALRQIASYYKEKNPNEWILVTDYAGKPKGKIKTNKNKVILELMKLLCKNKFEEKIFMLKYEGNQMRFFWEKIDSMYGKSLMQRVRISFSRGRPPILRVFSPCEIQGFLWTFKGILETSETPKKKFSALDLMIRFSKKLLKLFDWGLKFKF